MAFDLAAFGPRVREHAGEWDALGLEWRVGPIHPNYGKAVTGATFQNVEWIAEITVWDTGETELETVRLRDDQIINKHYDLGTIGDLDTMIDELLGLIRDGDTPPDAFIP